MPSSTGDYLEVGSEVHVDMFDDRLEIYSPGGMIDGTMVQNLDIMNVPSRRRNPVIADIFNRLRYMDRRGSGFKKIVEDYRLCEFGAVSKNKKILKIGSRVRSIADFYFCAGLVNWGKICIFVVILLLVCYSELGFKYGLYGVVMGFWL